MAFAPLRIKGTIGLCVPRRPSTLYQGFTTTASALSNQFPPRLKLDEKDITEKFIRGSGKGGQKINKTSSRVQLVHVPTGIMINCQDTRSRAQNRTLARRRLSERVEEHLKGSESRTAIKGEKAKKKSQSAAKKKRRKYRRLADEASSDEEDVELDEDDETASDKDETDLDIVAKETHVQQDLVQERTGALKKG